MKITRAHAKERLAKIQLSTLSVEVALELLTDYWEYERESDIRDAIAKGDLPVISDDLIHIIAMTDYPSQPLPISVEPLLIDALVLRLDRVKNSYIESELGRSGFICTIEGEVECAGLCPCCSYLSIGPGKEGLWDICPVCFWENGGEGPNRISLLEARKNFAKFGAITEKSTLYVDPDGTKKYLRQGEDA